MTETLQPWSALSKACKYSVDLTLTEAGHHYTVAIHKMPLCGRGR